MTPAQRHGHVNEPYSYACRSILSHPDKTVSPLYGELPPENKLG